MMYIILGENQEERDAKMMEFFNQTSEALLVVENEDEVQRIQNSFDISRSKIVTFDNVARQNQRVRVPGIRLCILDIDKFVSYIYGGINIIGYSSAGRRFQTGGDRINPLPTNNNRPVPGNATGPLSSFDQLIDPSRDVELVRRDLEQLHNRTFVRDSIHGPQTEEFISELRESNTRSLSRSERVDEALSRRHSLRFPFPILSGSFEYNIGDYILVNELTRGDIVVRLDGIASIMIRRKIGLEPSPAATTDDWEYIERYLITDLDLDWISIGNISDHRTRVGSCVEAVRVLTDRENLERGNTWD